MEAEGAGAAEDLHEGVVFVAWASQALPLQPLDVAVRPMPINPKGRTQSRPGAILRKRESESSSWGYPVSHCAQFGGVPAVPFGHLPYLRARHRGTARVPMASPRARQSAPSQGGLAPAQHRAHRRFKVRTFRIGGCALSV